jgi:hypothetical protein
MKPALPSAYHPCCTQKGADGRVVGWNWILLVLDISSSCMSADGELSDASEDPLSLLLLEAALEVKLAAARPNSFAHASTVTHSIHRSPL